MAETVVGANALRKRLSAISDTRQIIGLIALRGVAEAKAIVPVKTANLQRTIRIGRVTSSTAEVLAGGQRKVGYAAAVEFGTRPHIIRPRNAKALAWGGERRLSGALRSGSSPTHFARLVHHPGTRKQPYLVPGVRKAIAASGIKAKIIDVWNRAA